MSLLNKKNAKSISDAIVKSGSTGVANSQIVAPDSAYIYNQMNSDCVDWTAKGYSEFSVWTCNGSGNGKKFAETVSKLTETYLSELASNGELDDYQSAQTSTCVCLYERNGSAMIVMSSHLDEMEWDPQHELFAQIETIESQFNATLVFSKSHGSAFDFLLAENVEIAEKIKFKDIFNIDFSDEKNIEPLKSILNEADLNLFLAN
jgi:hypothetical protein